MLAYILFRINGEVKPSMKKRNYSVKISYDLKEGVKQAHRTCPREEALDRLKERLKKPQQVKETGQSKPAKRIRKKPSISSSSEDIEPESPAYMDSDNSGEFWREFEDGNMNNTEDVDQTVTISSWVLVKYCTKKVIKHFVGMVTESCDEGAAVILPFTDYEKKLMNVLQLSVDGLPSEGDSDHILTGVTLEKVPETAIPAAEVNNDNASSSNSGLMGQQLSCSAEHNGIAVKATSKLNQNQIVELSTPKKLKYYRQDPSITNQSIDVLPDSQMQLRNLPYEIASKKESEHGEHVDVGNTASKWKSWNPQQLKRKVHKSLSGTPRTSGSVTKNSLNNKIDGLTNSRIELIKLQKEIAETEIKCKKGQQGILENEECRRTEEHLQVMSNLNLQHEILLDLHERHKTESNLRQELLLLQIQNQKLEIATKQKRF
ncbi:hypothetical protein RN001_003674 [Aquatica leii]|uniref:Uncharacterized protein n=1 Tax=Aquatica leii TaxID=1421715 RepID=A0AAN7QP85_9COLE|nr:hypothetical protein RN001_003674 [Aquatica leii]